MRFSQDVMEFNDDSEEQMATSTWSMKMGM